MESGIEMQVLSDEVPEGLLRTRSQFFKKHIPSYETLPDEKKAQFKRSYLIASDPRGINLTRVETPFDIQALVYCILMYKIGGRHDNNPYVPCYWDTQISFKVAYDYSRFLSSLSSVSDKQSLYYTILLLALLLRTTLAEGRETLCGDLLWSIFESRYDGMWKRINGQIGDIAPLFPPSLHQEIAEVDKEALVAIKGSLFNESTGLCRNVQRSEEQKISNNC